MVFEKQGTIVGDLQWAAYVYGTTADGREVAETRLKRRLRVSSLIYFLLTFCRETRSYAGILKIDGDMISVGAFTHLSPNTPFGCQVR